MPVAPSFQKYEMIGEPFISSSRQYVNVKHPNTGNIRQVRWYSDIEYAKLYPEKPAVSRSTDPYSKPQKEVLGFTKGYITIFKGDTFPHVDWFRASIARYARWWGWYIISTEEVPADLPEGIEPVKLDWTLVGTENGTLKPEHQVKEGVDSILYEPSGSEYVGSIGERLELYLTVERVIPLENNFGVSQMHIMRDDVGNLYVWTTAAKSWAPGSEHHIRGTVKDHRTYKNDRQTVLTRCMEVK